MAPAGQRVFALIPTTLASTTGSRPPMTSKAAKKAYAKANQGQRVSRAEQRRLDAEELEKQKKEFEKEKAALRAKAAREKKQEKEEQARLERRKNGEPEKSKWVRASQPSIAKFVRGDGGKRTWQDMNENIAGAIVEEQDSDGERPAKRLAVLNEDDELSGVDDASPHLCPASGGGHREPAKSVESDDEFGEFPSLSQAGLLENTLSSNTKHNTVSPKRLRDANHRETFRSPDEVTSTPTQELPPRRKHFEDDVLFGNTQDEADLASAQLKSEEAEAASKSDPIVHLTGDISQDTRPSRTVRPTGINLTGAKSNDEADCVLKSPVRGFASLRSHKIPEDTIPSIMTDPRVTISFARSTPSYFPPSTQAFLEENIDDFMPSPSQEARELLDELDIVDLPSNTQIARELSPEQLPGTDQPRMTSIEDKLDDLICTQDLLLSSQDMREISPAKHVAPQRPRPPPRNLVSPPIFKKPFLPKSNINEAKAKPTDPSLKQRIQPPQVLPGSVGEAILDDFPCTQDFALSPSDLEELLTPSKAATLTKTKNNLDIEMGKLLAQKSETVHNDKVIPKNKVHNLPQPSSKARVNQPAIQHETMSKKNYQQNNTSHPAPAQPREPLRDVSSSNTTLPRKPLLCQSSTAKPPSQPNIKAPQNQVQPKPKARLPPKIKPRFFEEKETDLFEAAIHESKIMSMPKKVQSKPPSRPAPLHASHTRKAGNKSDLSSNHTNHLAGGGNGERQAAHLAGTENGIQPLSMHKELNDEKDDKAKPTKRSNRSLQRVHSAVTDYGDDEFDGLCAEDFEGLC